MSDELLACPFCGGCGEHFEGCYLILWTRLQKRPSDELALATRQAWNRRAPPSVLRTHHRSGAPLPTSESARIAKEIDDAVNELGDCTPCRKCGSALDTGLECSECGYDMAPTIRDAAARGSK